FKYGKDHLCSTCEWGKSKKASHPPKLVPSSHSKLELLHMDLYDLMRVVSINGNKHNKTPYELLRGRKPNVEYLHVFGSLCYLTNDRDDLGKIKPKADIAESMNTPFKEDLDNLFGPMYDKYFEKKSFGMPINSTAQQVHNQEDSSSTSLIGIEAHEAPPIVTISEEQTSPVSLTVADEFYQEDSAELEGNTLLTPYDALDFSEAESPTNLDPSNMHEFHQVQPSTHIWTKAHLLEQVIGDPSKPVMTQHRLQTDPEVCMYALTVSSIEPKNIKEAMSNHNFPDQVYRLKKALYGLKQAPRAWYDQMSSFQIEHHFTKGELKFFLRLQVHQSPHGIYISQSQYAIELLKKHGMDEYVSMSTPMATKRLDADLQGTPTDQTTYCRMIGGLMYLTASRPDIAFATFVYACYQAHHVVKHIKEVKRIFRYLRYSY
ncbi:retrovirus-related pol polyprotein from transposon TNT 1-94, partial [Tanacetum coccineum]